MGMDIKEILDIIPHRQPFLLLDKVEEIVEGESITAIKNVTYNEPFFAGHFPKEPVMPGVLIIEAMKFMNEVNSEESGKIAEVLVNDGDFVEFGQPLFRVE